VHTGCGQICVAFGVVFLLRFVDLAVNFNDELGCMAVEVNDLAIEHLLAAEMQPAELVCPKVLP
jgi:hypothetical protein